MGKNFSKNQHFADFSACSGHPVLKKLLDFSWHSVCFDRSFYFSD
jgi:hypothetical protein